MKDAYYFSHDSNARNDPKILAMIARYGMEGYGRWWVLVEMLREQGDYRLPLGKWTTSALAMTWGCQPDQVDDYVSDCTNEFDLLRSDGEHFWSETLMRRMDKLQDIRQKRRDAGRIGGVRSGETRKQTKQNEAPLEANEPKESTVKESTVKDLSCPEIQLALYLRDRIRSFNPRRPHPKGDHEDPKIQSWAVELEKLNRLGPVGGKNQGYGWEEIRGVIDWVFDHSEFWAPNIQSAVTLRKQMHKIEERMKHQKQGGGGAPKPKPSSAVEEVRRVIEERERKKSTNSD